VARARADQATDVTVDLESVYETVTTNNVESIVAQSVLVPVATILAQLEPGQTLTVIRDGKLMVLVPVVKGTTIPSDGVCELELPDSL